MFRMNGRVIAKTEFARCMERVSRAAEELSEEGFPHPTAFEVDTALAFLWFQEKKCDIAIAEAGMGGLLDSTNVIPDPLVCVLTSISMDHMAALGDTLEAIAAQKAGIHKAEEQGGQPQTEAGGHAGDRRGLPGEGVQPADRGSGKALRREKEPEGAAFFVREWKGLEIPFAGTWQTDNAALALEALAALSGGGLSRFGKKLRQGLSEVSWPGRFQVFPGEASVRCGRSAQ